MTAVGNRPGVRRTGAAALGALLLAATVLAGCSSDGGDGATATTTTTTTTATTSTAPAQGEPGPGCEQGWTTPEPGSEQAAFPIEVILGQMGVDGELDVVDERAFTGPEVPWILEPRPDHVDWWYVKATLAGDPAFAGRWLVSRRDADRQGIDAVAPFDSRGYASPDWRAFEGEGAPRPIDGLPGEWPGLEYDFVVGDSGSQPGLPDEVVACLDGT